MGFRFSLETVLRLRRGLEDSERLRLQELHFQRAQLERQLAATVSSQTALSAALQAAMAKQAPLCGGEIGFSDQRLRACQQQAERLRNAAACLDQRVIRQQAVLLERRTQRQVLEQLRGQQWSQYERETQRRAQAQIEELFLLRRWREADEGRKPAPSESAATAAARFVPL